MASEHNASRTDVGAIRAFETARVHFLNTLYELVRVYDVTQAHTHAVLCAAEELTLASYNAAIADAVEEVRRD